MFALTENAVKIGDVIEYAVGILPALVIATDTDGVTLLNADFTTTILPFAEGYWVKVKGRETCTTWVNRHTGKTQSVTNGKVVHRSTNGLRVMEL